MRGARTGCVGTLGAAARAVTERPSSAAALPRAARSTPRIRKEPRVNFRPAASNGSSAASKAASGNRKRSVASALSALWLTA